jgi:hypothetical protein
MNIALEEHTYRVWVHLCTPVTLIVRWVCLQGLKLSYQTNPGLWVLWYCEWYQYLGLLVMMKVGRNMRVHSTFYVHATQVCNFFNDQNLFFLWQIMVIFFNLLGNFFFSFFSNNVQENRMCNLLKKIIIYNLCRFKLMFYYFIAYQKNTPLFHVFHKISKYINFP